MDGPDDDEAPSSLRETSDSQISRLVRTWRAVRKELNFFRVHLLFFTITPLICSGILYAVNGKFKINYIDCLFNCVSAIAVCGLATINLSEMTALQQVILFIQMCLGSPVTVAWFTVLVRRHYFEKDLEHLVEKNRKASLSEPTLTVPGVPWHIRIRHKFQNLQKRHNRRKGGSKSPTVAASEMSSASNDSGQRSGTAKNSKLRVDMIKRLVDDKPRLINPMGWISENREQTSNGGRADPGRIEMREQGGTTGLIKEDGIPQNAETPEINGNEVQQKETERRNIAPGADVVQFEEPELPNREARRNLNENLTIPRTHTVEFNLPSLPNNRDHGQSSDRPFYRRRASDAEFRRSSTLAPSDTEFRRRARTGQRNSQSMSGGTPLETSLSISSPPDGPSPLMNPHFPSRTATIHSVHSFAPTHHTHLSRQGHLASREAGLGGFPGPHQLVYRMFSFVFPHFARQLKRTTTIPPTLTHDANSGSAAPYVSFDAIIGHNSAFHMLTADDLDELGGVEYRALNALLWIVGFYHLGLQIMAFTIIAPYISTSRWHQDFLPPQLKRSLAAPWFALFQVVSAYTNTGMSLVDQSMIPFQTAYLMIFVQGFLILAGNTAFPVFLRLLVWTISRLVPKKTRLHETIHFLLDHPRRCFLYLFPSHQTWFLLTLLVILNCTDWFFFLVLDIGNPEIEQIPVGTRIAIGWLQALAVRAAGFVTVTLSALAPAVRVLYVIMMYVSVYPIAMSVRSTNVYEENSLGIYEGSDTDEPNIDAEESRTAVWGKYVGWHIRKQLAFDMWWLALALFLICIIERGPIEDIGKPWFDIFTIIFELVSAYGTVGLSLGVPYDNFSFSGSLNTLSKLVVCAVMLRGRHRGLPVAIDRAILIPFEFKKDQENLDIDAFPRTRTQMSQGSQLYPTLTQHDETPNASSQPTKQNISSVD